MRVIKAPATVSRAQLGDLYRMRERERERERERTEGKIKILHFHRAIFPLSPEWE